MEIRTHIPLKNYTTMRLGGPARFIADVHSVEELKAIHQRATEQGLAVFVIGGGSNLIATDEGFNGLVMRIRIPGFSVDDDQEGFTIISVGAGESWDETVRKTVDMRLSGIEAMSAIPGTVGAAPVQNVGAYGQEMADTLMSVEAFDTSTAQMVTLSHEDCGFSYRLSIFRGEAQGRYIITKVTMKLWKSLPAPPFYESLQSYFDTHAITTYTHQIVRDAVIAIRKDKLPDPMLVANSGSFFKNPIVEQWQFNDIQKRFPNAKSFAMADGRVKIPAGWLIEAAGLKGKLTHGMRVYEKNALVLVNESAQSYNDLAEARSEITDTIRDIFQITIEQEPLEVR